MNRDRRLRLALLIIGAAVAFLGTGITEFWKSDLEKTLESAQSRFSSLQALRVQTYEQIQQARSDAEISLVLDGDTKHAAELEYYARYYARDAAEKIKDTLDRRTKASVVKVNRATSRSVGSVHACTLPPPPDPRIPRTRSHAPKPAVSFVGTLAAPWSCYNDRLSKLMIQDELKIRSYRERIRAASTIATITQLIGILIALGKDVVE